MSDGCSSLTFNMIQNGWNFAPLFRLLIVKSSKLKKWCGKVDSSGWLKGCFGGPISDVDLAGENKAFLLVNSVLSGFRGFQKTGKFAVFSNMLCFGTAPRDDGKVI